MATRKNSTEQTPDTDALKSAGEQAEASAPAADTPKPARRKPGPKPKIPQSDAAVATASATPTPARRGPARRAPAAEGGNRPAVAGASKPAAKPGRKPAADGRRNPGGKPGRKPTVPATSAARPRKLAWSLGGLALAAGAGLVAFLTRGRIATLLESATAAKPNEGHVPTDLLDPNRNAADRAVADFRPDMGAPMTTGERAALAPATGPSPSLVADRGDMRSEVGPAG